MNEGEGCPKDGCAGKLVVGKAVEVGHIFKLGYKYSESMGARVLDVNGKEVTPIMGSYGIGIERILTAAIEQSNDKNGFWLPASIAPFTVVVTITNMATPLLAETGEKLAAELEAAGLDVLLDDRDERAGVKFKDADLVGIPYRINVGKKAAEGQVELVTRATTSSVDVALPEVLALVKKRVEEDALLTAAEAEALPAYALRDSHGSSSDALESAGPQTELRMLSQGAAMALKIRIRKAHGKASLGIVAVAHCAGACWRRSRWCLLSSSAFSTSSTRALWMSG